MNVGYSHAMFNAAIVRALDAASIVERVHVLVAKSALESKPFGGVAALPKVKVREALPEGSNGRGRWGQIKRSVGCHAQMFRAVRWRRSVVSVHLAADNFIAPLWLLFDRLVRGGCAYVILHNNAHGVRASRAIRLLWGGVFRAGVRPVVLAKSVYDFYYRLYPNTPFNLRSTPVIRRRDRANRRGSGTSRVRSTVPVPRAARPICDHGGVSPRVHFRVLGSA